jgi:hypothetical protein
MHVNEYEKLLSSTELIMIFLTSHLTALISDEAHGTDEAKEALERTFEHGAEGSIAFGLAEILAVRLIREAADSVLGGIEVLIEEKA